MGISSKLSVVVLLLVMCHGLLGSMSFAEGEAEDLPRRGREEEEEEEQPAGSPAGSYGGSDGWFLLRDAKPVYKTDAGEMRVVKSLGHGRHLGRHLRIGFIAMEPKTLLIPQYLDSSLIIFIRRGEAKLGFIYGGDLVERRLKNGDVHKIAAGSAFYLVNTGEGQRLHVICSIDTSESLGMSAFQSFFIAGGTYPTSILSGFSNQILENAFNVSSGEVSDILKRQQQGPIVYVTDPHPPSLWSKFLELKEHDRLQHLKRMVDSQQADNDEEEEEEEEQRRPTWSWRKLLSSVFGDIPANKKRDEKGRSKSPDSYNLYDKKADYSNDYGYSKVLDESEYDPLKSSGIGIYLVNLTAGSMMAPHLNPRATEYGIVLRGAGTIQIVFPNGTTAMNAEVKEGDVFWVPRYFPFCQIASRTGPFEFFGFTTSAKKNRPQFLAGASSVLRTMRGPEIAAAFGVTEERYRRFVDAQREAVILPSAAAPPYKGEEEEEEEGKSFPPKPKLIKSFANDLIIGFD
ncbi:hypothetical protein FNV43_RR05488 [Rhamnella rubrinervis]|uniref:Cupin type-1 domain-containing protein n=1 Tax=Rhamnella rubrinervis TaxID=2594499 RepID=A0A8K0HNV2_9ROSA|nr:hypothetical protein FNV43_RR05488 [Rhamnella rubrinervis]